MPGKITLSELAKLTGLRKTVLRRYVLLGLIEPLKKRENRKLLFDQHMVRTAKIVHMLNKSGYTLDEIRRIFINSRRRKN